MAITVQGVSGPIVAKELISDYGKGIAGQGPYVNKKYFVDWDSANEFANALMGLTTNVGGIAGTIVRQAPHQCPESPNIFAISVGTIEGWGKPVIDGGRPRYEKAIVPVVYGISPFQLGGTLNNVDPFSQHTFDGNIYPYCSQSIDYTTESFTRNAGWKYADGSFPTKPITDSHITVDVPVATMSLTMHRVPFLPTAEVFALLKKTNNATFLGQPAGSVLFDRIRTSVVYNTDGTKTQEMEYAFRWRKVGHNKVPDPLDSSTWVLFTHDGTLPSAGGRVAYPEADLLPLLFGVDVVPGDPQYVLDPYTYTIT